MKSRILSVAVEIGDTRNAAGVLVHNARDEIELGISVAHRAIARSAGVDDIRNIIFASSGIRQIFPSGAASIAAALERNCASFDITSGCTAINTSIGIASRLPGQTLVVGVDLLSRTVDPGNATHFALRNFADGATAVLIGEGAQGTPEIVGQIGRTAGEWRQFYGAANGKIRRSLPDDERGRLRSVYVENWTHIGQQLFGVCPPDAPRWVYANQGDERIFPTLEAALDLPVGHLVRTDHGHAGGVDPWVAFVSRPPPAGSYVLMLSSGVGFTFHGLLIRMPQNG